MESVHNETHTLQQDRGPAPGGGGGGSGRHRSLRHQSFVISLAVSDLFVAVLVMPWRAVSEVAGIWLFGRFCDTWVAFDIMCSTASILNLCIISMDRYWAISSPFKYERKMTRRFAFLMIGVAFYIPVVIMVGTYTRIFRIAQTQIRRISSLERAAGPVRKTTATARRRTTKVRSRRLQEGDQSSEDSVLIMGCRRACVSDTTFSIFVWFGWANSSLNPVIYAFNADFRKAFSTILGCNKYCSTTVETVDFSNELVSYHHDTLQKEACPVPGPGAQRLATCMVVPHTGG
ncbi:hypothetical protein INR49_010408, partial [Caranx melampygus]